VHSFLCTANEAALTTYTIGRTQTETIKGKLKKDRGSQAHCTATRPIFVHYLGGTALSKSAEELPVLRRVPDVQDFNGVVFHAVGDDVRQPPVQQFAGAFLTSLASTLGKLFKRADGFTDFNDGGLR